MVEADSLGRALREIRLSVPVDGPVTEEWLGAFDFVGYGVRPLLVRGGTAASGEGDGFSVRSRRIEAPGPGEVPDLGDAVHALAASEAAGVLLLRYGLLGRVVRFAAEMLGLPVFTLVTSAEEFGATGPGPKGRPDLLFLADAGLFPAAVSDPRFGLTVLPTGHPARDLAVARRGGPAVAPFDDERFGDGHAADRMLKAIRARVEGAPTDGPELSVVVPAFKESANLPAVCGRLLEVLEAASVRAEILLVDDASPDDTYAVALSQMWRSPRIRALTKGTPRGMGNAIRHGLRHARGPYVAITMGDGSDEVEKIPEMLRTVRDGGYGLAIGSRYRLARNYEAVPPLYRFWSRCFRLTTRALVGLRLADYTNAFRLFRSEVFERYGIESGGFEISPEITFKAWLATRRVAEVDVRHLKRTSGQSNFSFLRAGPGYGKILFKALVARMTGRWFTLDW